MAKEAKTGFGITEDPRLEANGVLVNDERAEKPSWMKWEVWKMASGFMAAVAAVLAMGGMMNKARADIIADFSDFSTFLDVPPEMEGPGTTTSCSVTPEGNIRWRHAYSLSPADIDIKEGTPVINPDGTVTIDPATITTVYGDPGVSYTHSFRNDPAIEFLHLGSDLLRNGVEVIDGSGVGGSGFYRAFNPYVDGESIAMRVHMGRVIDGATTDSGDIVIMPEMYPGPPMPIATLTDLRANVTPIPELSPDPTFFNPAATGEAYIQSGIAFCNEIIPHAYVSQECRFGIVSDCLFTEDDTTVDPYLFNYNESSGIWDTTSMVEIASTPDNHEFASCVLSNENAECLFVGQGTGLGTVMKYKCHLRDSDSDGVNDFDDNCDFTANTLQENVIHPGDLEGDACDDPDMDGVFDINDNCPNITDPTNVCSVMPEPPMDAGTEPPVDAPIDVIPDMPIPDEGVDAGEDGIIVMPEPPMDAGTEPPVDAPIDVIPDMPIPDEGVDIPSDVTTDMPMDLGLRDETLIENPDSDLPDGINGNGDTEKEVPPSPNGCTCVLAEKPEESKNRFTEIAALILAASSLMRRRKKRVTE